MTTGGDIAPSITHNTFGYNVYGVFLQPVGDGNITSVIQNNSFTHNVYGLGTGESLYGVGASRPSIQTNNFNNNTRLPIYLGGSAFPIYGGNTFQGYPTPTQRLGIGLGGEFTQSGTWTIVNNMPYVVVTHTLIMAGEQVTLPLGSVVKFDAGGASGGLWHAQFIGHIHKSDCVYVV